MRTLNRDRLCDIEKYIIDYQRDHGKAPHYRDILDAMRMSSLNLVQRYVLALEKEGRITRTRRGGIDVLPQLKPNGSVMIPLVGDIACGNPSEAIQNIEANFALPKVLFGNGDFFMVRASGESMIEIGIQSGDLIVIRRQNTAEDGDVVAALVNGESTLKRLYHKGGAVILHPENSTMQDIVVKAEDCSVQGVLVSCIKMY